MRFIPFGRRGFSVSEILGNKGALETLIETPKGIIKVINTHLHYQSSKILNTASIRLRQLRDIFSATISDQDIPVILLGDFNEDAMFTKHSFESIFTSNGFSSSEADTRAPTYRKENPLVNNWINRVRESYRYDYIVTKYIEKTGLSIYSYATLYLDPPLSDHDPVSMVLL